MLVILGPEFEAKGKTILIDLLIFQLDFRHVYLSIHHCFLLFLDAQELLTSALKLSSSLSQLIPLLVLLHI